jgi:hypothetical protein
VKRFYKEAAAAPAADGVAVLLDARPVKTPARRALALPTEELAEAIAAEWNAQGDEIDPRAMPLTGLANAALDRIAADREAFAAGLARYGESDLLCYRAEGPRPLVERQAAAWDPLLAWARRRYDVDFEVTSGILHRPPPPSPASPPPSPPATRSRSPRCRRSSPSPAPSSSRWRWRRGRSASRRAGPPRPSTKPGRPSNGARTRSPPRRWTTAGANSTRPTAS